MLKKAGLACGLVVLGLFSIVGAGALIIPGGPVPKTLVTICLGVGCLYAGIWLLKKVPDVVFSTS